ncbi:MAG: ABC transporter permease subunit [Oscillospiraceae bacterium]|jgi:ABC-2 type transport system permease protein
MRKLLSAGFARLWKSMIFWLGMIFMAGFSTLAVVDQYWGRIKYPDFSPYPPDYILFANGTLIPIVIAVFIGIFIGTEYSDGTMRNKLIVGHTRTSIYCSNFVVCIAASALMHIAYVTVILCAGIPLLGKMQTDLTVLFQYFSCSLVIIAAFTAIFLLISMLIQSKSTGAVAAIIVSLVLLFSAMMINNRLTAPEYYDAYTYTDDSGNEHTVEAERNPQYLTGTKRQVYEFLWDALPSCQILQISSQNAEHLGTLSLYSFAIVILAIPCGTLIFRKKDLK